VPWIVSKKMNLVELFQNKSISVVGSAESLFGEKYGPQIDKSDLVCRFNRGGLILNPEAQGKKQNVLFFNGLNNTLISGYDTTIQTSHRHKKHDRADYILPLSNKEELSKRIGVDRPSSGLMVLYFLYNLNCSVNIFGFDFKKTKSFYHTKYLFNGVHDYEKEKTFVHNTILKKKEIKFNESSNI
jgi:hypothetical protein